MKDPLRAALEKLLKFCELTAEPDSPIWHEQRTRAILEARKALEERMSEPVDVEALAREATTGIIRSGWAASCTHVSEAKSVLPRKIREVMEPVIRRLEAEVRALREAEKNYRSSVRDLATECVALREERDRLQQASSDNFDDCVRYKGQAVTAEMERDLIKADVLQWKRAATEAEARTAKLEAYAGDLAQMLRALLKSPGLLSENEPFRAMVAGALTLAPPSGPSTGEVKEKRSKEWWLARARAEGDATIGAVGGAVEPLRCAYPLTNLSSRPGLPECGNLMPCVEHAGWCEPNPAPPAETPREDLREGVVLPPPTREQVRAAEQVAQAPEHIHNWMTGTVGCPSPHCKPEPPGAERIRHEYVRCLSEWCKVDHCQVSECGQPAAAHEGKEEK